jgi:hypothetical protein
VGQKLGITFAGGQERLLLVAEVSAESVTLDGNHPLAGCDLTFACGWMRLTEFGCRYSSRHPGTGAPLESSETLQSKIADPGFHPQPFDIRTKCTMVNVS